MKKSIYILSIIIMSLLSFGATAQAQIEQYSEDYQLDCYADYGISGDFAHLLKIEDYRRFFTKVSSIKRVDEKTIILNPYGNAIKVVIDKGRISIRDPFYCTPCDNLKNTPIETKYWIADNLKEEDENITVSVYTKSNILLGQYTYNFKKNVNYGLFQARLASKESKLYTVTENFYPYSAEFHYFKNDGTEKFIDNINGGRISSQIDYDKPMTVVLRDYWGKKYNALKFSLSVFSGNYEEAYIRCEGGKALSGQSIKLMKHFNYVQIIEILFQGRNGEPCMATPLKIIKD